MALRKLTEEAEDDQKKKKQKVGFYKLFTHADRVDVALMILGTIGAIASGSSQPISTLAFSRLVNSIGQTDQSQLLDEVSKVALKIFFIAIAAAIAGYLQAFCWTVTGQRQSSRIRTLYLKALLRQEIAFFDTKMTSGEVITTISGDAILVHEAMGLKVGQFIEYTSMFVSAFTVALFRGWFLSVVLLLCVPPLALVGGSLALITSKISAHGQLAYAEAGNVVEQTLRAIRTVASFCGEKRTVVKYDEKLRKAYVATVQQGLVSGLGMGLMLFTSFACYGFAIWYGCRLIREKGYSGGDVMNVIIAIMIAGSSLAQMSPCINAFSAGQAAAVKLFETIDRQPLINSSDETGIAPENLEGEIEFRDVHFRYPSRPDVKIFAGFSLHVPKGRTLALVGQSGSGKSSIVSLLQRFYDPEAGKILIDGVDLKNYRLEYIRQKMGLVSQEPVLFTTSIKENILYAKPDATEEEIRTAVELANCAEFIDKLPNGIHTMVGENGTQLSGGQKQRICIARAVIKDPKILLLDEATSALDMASESNVQYALEKMMPNRTTIVVAHRLSTVKNAHLIAILHAGKLVEQGAHNDLIQDPNGAYRQLLRMQERGAGERKTGKEEHAEGHIDSPLKTDKYFANRAPYKRVSPSFEHVSSEFDLYRESSRKNDNTVEGSKTDASNKKKSTIKRLAHLNRTELPALLVGSLAAATHGVAYPVFGLLLATAFGIFTKSPNELQKDSKFWALMFVSVGSVVLIAAPIQNFMFGISGGKLVKRVRSLMFERVVHQEISWFDDTANSSGAIGARLSTDASMLRNLVVDTLSLAVQNFATALAGLLIAFFINWKLALTIVVVVPLMLIEGFIRMKLVQDGNNKVLYEEATQVANDAIGGIRTVASFCCEEKFMKNYQRKCKTPMKQGIWNGNVGGISLGFANFVLFSIYSFSFYIGAVLTNHYQERFVQVFKVFFALQVSSIGISQSGNLLANFKKSKESAASIFDIIDQRPKIDSCSQDGLKLESLNGDIRFHHVSFTYPTRPDIQIFLDLNILISAGKTNALVGESGSGKSTVISLLQRFYDQDSGHIYLDGIDIRKMNLSWLRQQMGLVSQEPILFNETIRDNISYGSNLGNSSEEEIIEAAKAANAHTFISALPQGYDTYVGERGTQLSGGQKQRVAIARVILKNPKILLLDEATSALDAESECLVMDALDRVRVNRTTIIVAHRLSTVKGADTITVVKNGVVAETGSHDVLVGISGGIYAGLVALSSAASN